MNFKKKLIIAVVVLAGIPSVSLTVFYQVSPMMAKNLVKAIQTGFIFHPEAYSQAQTGTDFNVSLLDHIRLPEGFRIHLYVDRTPGARSMVLSPDGTVFVGTRDEGSVYAVIDRDLDYRAEQVITIARDLTMPNGVAMMEKDLYVAEVSRILRYKSIDKQLKNPQKPDIVYDGFPGDTHHGWKFMAFGPDKKLYVPVGAPCNVCRTGDPYAAITRMNPDGTGFEIFARGVRNTVGFDWHPDDGALWFTDNGRDWMGDGLPPDELNRAPSSGLHFGFPYCHGKDVADPEFGNRQDCRDYRPPEIELGPHVAALGMRFYEGGMFPARYRGSILIAEHGSWNRTVPIGYRITRVTVSDNKALDYSVFAEGWRYDGETWGRPVDLLIMPDGSLLVSDDMAGAIYRIVYDP